MAQAQLDNGCGTLQSVAGDRVPLDHLLAADSDLLGNDAQLIVHDVIAPSSVLLIGEHIMTAETATFLLRFRYSYTRASKSCLHARHRWAARPCNTSRACHAWPYRT